MSWTDQSPSNAHPERSGVYVASLDFSAELHAKHHDAFSTWVGPSLEWALIVVRSQTSWERTRLSIAHELGHLVMHYIRRDGNLESDAYSFATEFLVPGPSLRTEWPLFGDFDVVDAS